MIGLFFGSFNPIHNGHLGIARYLLDNGYCSGVWFIVSPQNPLKADKTLLAQEIRLEMVQAAIAGDNRMRGCDIEFSMPKPSYTIDTLRKISSIYTNQQFALIIGGDNLRDFHLWRDYLTILSDFRILVYPRPGVDVSNLHYEQVTLVDAPLSPVSSTGIRKMLAEGEDVSPYVPSAILPILQSGNLYR